MPSDHRLPIFPTRGAMVMLKSRISAATKGCVLLQRKADALQYRFRNILADLISSKMAVGEAVREATFSLAKMRFVTGEMINPIIIETAVKANTRIISWDENYSGINIKVFQTYQDGSDAYELAGLSRGGQQLSAVKLKFLNLVNLVVELASLQTNFVAIDDALKITNRRVAAIENFVLPRFFHTLRYFESELEEFDREEFYRIKKLKEKKIGKSLPP